MDYICNRCYITKVRMNKPFSFTQCKHIFCDNCIKDASRRCTVCGFKSPAFISLQEPLPVEVASYFQPLDETLMSFKAAVSLQTAQLDIVLKRFDEIKKKYSNLKIEYHNVIQKTEYLTRKCNEYRNGIKEMEESLNYYKGVSPYVLSTSSDTVFSEDLRRFQSDCLPSAINITPDGFRIPTSCKVPKTSRKSSRNNCYRS